MKFIILALIIVFCLAGCDRQLTAEQSPSSLLMASPSLPLILEGDVPDIPALTYVNTGDNNWELKRLQLSCYGFKLLDERGRVSLQAGKFSLIDASDSTCPSYLEEDSEYLQQTFWSGLEKILLTETDISILGFLEYYGLYYLVADVEQNAVLYSLDLNPSFDGGMPFDEFCNNAWVFFVYLENYPTTVYGGDGITIGTLPD